MNKKIFKSIGLYIGLLCTTSLSYSQIINYAPVQELARIDDAAINEISGVASSYNNPETFWVHNDSGDTPRIFLVDKAGNTLTKGTITNASANDWEDIASFELNGISYLIIADIGDNASSRSQYSLYIIEEPNYNSSGTNPSSYAIKRRINFTYDTGAQNCESIAVDVQSGKIILVSKTSYQGSQKIRYVHELPLSVASGTVSLVAQKIQEFGTIAEATTGMDISNNGKYAIVHTVLDGNYEFTRNQNETWADAFAKVPRRIGIPEDRGFEAICYGTNGIDLYLMKEGLNSPILFYKGTINITSVSVTPTTATIADGATQQLTATVAPSNATNKTVTWSSSNTAVATVNTSGLVTAVNTGTATITATTQDGTKTDSSVITVTTASNTTQILQAENATFSGATIASNQTGYNGSGFIDFTNNTGDYVQWSVNVPTAGSYDLSFRYALPNGDRPLELKVNGSVKVASLDFPATGSWSSWSLLNSTQTLNAGNNTIRLTSIGSNGGNFDELRVAPSAKYLDTCDAITNWNSASANTLTYFTTDKKQGSGCIQMIGSATEEFKKVFSTAFNSGTTIANGALSFWYFVSDVSKIGTVRVELGSGGAADVNELSWPLSGLTNGWNQIILNTADATLIGTPNMSALNWFRIYDPKTASITTRIDAIQVMDASIAPSTQRKANKATKTIELEPNQGEKSITVYPNPYKDGTLSLDIRGFESSNEVQLKITNLLGQVIHQEILTDKSHKELNLSGRLNESVYFISLEDGENKVVKKLIIR